jgi:chromosome segregation ATPase
MKRNQIQIAIDALKKQLSKYNEQHSKAIDARSEAQQSVEFFSGEIERLRDQIKNLEGTNGVN